MHMQDSRQKPERRAGSKTRRANKQPEVEIFAGVFPNSQWPLPSYLTEHELGGVLALG